MSNITIRINTKSGKSHTVEDVEQNLMVLMDLIVSAKFITFNSISFNANEIESVEVVE